MDDGVGVPPADGVPALARCRTLALDRPRVLLEYHDALLFLLAYPGTRDDHRDATRELVRVARALRVLACRDTTRGVLEGSGVAWSQTEAGFSLPIVRWLLRRHASEAGLASVDAPLSTLTEVLALALPSIDAEILALAARPLALLDAMAGGSGPLRFLVDQVGAERVMMGTDYPFEMGDPEPVRTVDSIPGLTAEERERILGGNFARILQGMGR